ncbi:MAG: CRISPR-associated protein Csn1, partial [Flavobacteriales bacterium]|nr:CRISPR-associated protein Csn1 [Flavobacteriales bacterium]
MKKILGLDLGTNSIGWALVEQDFENKQGQILGLGSRIIPMPQDILTDFGKGTTKSQTADRTKARGVRRLYQRDNLRRERLHRVLNILNFLPQHFKNEIDFEFHKGQFINYGEPKLPFFKNDEGKYEFLFKDSYNEMVEEFKKAQPDLFYTKANGKETKIPYDWTIYYLRKKALSLKISKEELAWLILNFNQKRGYYQLSEDEQENDENKIKEFVVLKVGKLIETGEIAKKTGDKLFKVFFENGWEYDKPTARPQDWEGKTKEFIVTTSETKDGKIKRSYKAVDSEQDWIAIKKKTEQEIGKSGETIGTYIYETLLTNPTQKIRGKLVRTIERKFYKDELKSILETQIELHTDLQSKKLYSACINELYPNNEAHRKNIENRGFLYLFMDDIIFYQRPLKTKTYLISDCSLEYRIRKDTKEKVYIKCIAKSNPIFQEFRLWQFLANLKIYERERDGNFDVDVTMELLNSEDEWVKLFDSLNDKEEISQKQMLSYFKLNVEKYRWNFVDEPDKKYPCNETRFSFLSRFKKLNIDSSFLTPEVTQHLWHLLYSVTDPEERKSAIKKFATKHSLNTVFEELFAKFPPFKRDYGSFSEKAIKKLLPFMRKGIYWSEDNISEQAKTRINSIIERLETIKFELNRLEEITDDVVPKQVLKSFINSDYSLKGLNTYQASYLVYGRHSEASDTKKWATSQDIADFLNPKLKGSFKQHSLRNPIVEQVLTETLRVVKDIWDEFGNGEESYFDEIHIELGREMKNDKKTRERISKTQNENENTNLRIRAILNELLNDGLDVKPYSPSQQEILKIYEEGVFQNENKKEALEEIEKIRKNASPSKSEIQRYKLWLEQGYISPYTGKSIMLSELFTHKYQIEHIFPQSRYFDDSLSNKIICEAEVNQLKDNRTAYEFIKEFGGTSVDLGQGRNIKVFTIPEYEQHVKTYFNKNKIKRENLLNEDIPESFINRQMNDSRYISKVV